MLMYQKKNTPHYNDHSFRKKGMEEALGFLEEINMIANVGGWEMDLVNKKLYWTDGTKRIQDLPASYKPEFDDALSFYKEGENHERLQHLVRQAITAGEPFEEEFQLVTAKNREIWVRLIGIPEIVDDRCVRLFGSVQDITETKKLLEKNQRLTQLYEAILQLSGKLIQTDVVNMGDAIREVLKKLGELNQADRVFIFEFDQKTESVKNTYEWRRTTDETKSTNWQDIPLDFLPGWKEKLKNMEPFYFQSPAGKNKKNDQDTSPELCIGSLIAAPMFFGEDLIGFAGFATLNEEMDWGDLTFTFLKITADGLAGSIGRMRYEKTLIAAKQEAEATNLSKSEFLVNMAHEIKTRLHEILGFSQIVLNNTDNAAHRQPLEIVDKSGSALLALINDMLEFSKIEVSAKIAPTPTNLRDLLENLKDFFLPVIEKKNLTFQIQTDPNLPELKLDQLRLRQVLIKLIDNALKYTNQGSINVSVKAEESENLTGSYHLKISIQDTGIGITKNKKESINRFFEKPESIFIRDDSSKGLGLQLARTLTSIMKGKIEMESEIGRGSTFTISFFDVEADKGDEQKTTDKTQPASAVFNDQMILVVDDVITHYLLIKSILENFHLNFIYAKSGEAGIEKAINEQPDLILMDINMSPGINGYEATRRLRENKTTAKIPIIAYTTNTLDDAMDKNKYLFDDVVAKVPLRLPRIIETLTKFLEYEKIGEDQSNEIMSETQNDRETNYLKDLINSFRDRVSNLVEVIDFTETERLISDLEEFQKQQYSARLEKYITKLKKAHDTFDFDSLTRHLSKFEQHLTC
jgi:signal transduction histidine kinase/DNA-binding NarL/FixJ family response regulator